MLASPSQPPGEFAHCDGPSSAELRRLSQARPAAGQRRHSPWLYVVTLLNGGVGDPGPVPGPADAGLPTSSAEVTVPHAATLPL